MAPRMALRVADRTVLAMSCRRCGVLKPGDAFPRYRRSARDRMAFISRRCVTCWWKHMAESVGR